MKSNYKRLGDYIRPVDVRNKDLRVTRLLGVSIEKKFIESIANTIGTDMTTYKIVKKGQFAYGPVTSRNGDKISIALLEEDECIISSSYSVFEIIDTEILLPQYLNLWFKRPEFDRYARFHSHGSAREIFDWEEMCNVKLPIPLLAEQQKIVDAYNTIEHRIELKHKINENLEAQMQNLFNNDLACLLSTDLSANYNIISLSEIAKYINGLAMQNYIPKSEAESLPVLKIRELRQGYCDLNSDRCTSRLPSYITVHNGDIIFSWSGSLMVDIWSGGNAGLNQHLFNVVSNKYPKWLTYLWTKYYLANFIRIADGKKTSMGHIKREDLEAAKVVVPQALLLEQLDKKYNKIFAEIVSNKIELNTIRQIRNLLLSTLSR